MHIVCHLLTKELRLVIQLKFSPMRRTSMMQSIPSEVMNLQVERLSRILLSSTRKET